MDVQLTFGSHGPFDAEEQDIIRAVVAAAPDSSPAAAIADDIVADVDRLERFGALVDSYPALIEGGPRHEGESLLSTISCSNPSNFDVVLPTKALLGRDMVMAEMNFYRSLQRLCALAVPPSSAEALTTQVNRLLCLCVYARLAEEVLKHIASDETLDQLIRERAAVGLAQIWGRNTYRLQDMFPVLEAAWEARRQVPAMLGTLMGTHEIFGLLREGCDPAFVDYLACPEQSPDEADAFREFLFGTHTEDLARFQQEMIADGRAAIDPRGPDAQRVVVEAHEPDGDPATALFEFFLSRHIQAGARRIAGLPGPKRTAEEYVVLHYLEHVDTQDLVAAAQ